jgi:uncharacterized protein YyaL (SSP411 family)
MANRLSRETSPYLRQHADNPVDWRPWGPEAFAAARAQAKPIFLSIGYSTCHWCHVMARESFENPAIAALLNEYFIPIKVDREERPDVDRVYMSYVQALTGRGGWPLSAWLTPELKPFYGGTYFPPEDRPGRAGFPSVLRALADGWANERDKLVAEAERVLASLRGQSRAEQAVPPEGAGAPPEPGLHESAGSAFEKGFHFLYQGFDHERGGFGGAPKFPRASNLSFLFRCAALQGPTSEVGKEAVNMAAFTLVKMAGGGIHDHVGGGFHRYAVDADWFIPHFEKMLYDQALIAMNALEAWQATADERMAWLARDILDYVLRDLADPAGGFHSAEDADSVPPGAADSAAHAEGAYYIWSQAELARVLTAEEAALVGAHFGVKAEGNVPADQDPFHEFTGQNILAQTKSLGETATALGLAPEVASDRLVAALDKLRVVRARRPRPARDDKVLAAWNGLMISALARAAALPADCLADRRGAYRAAAVRAAEFIRRELWDEARGIIFRSWRGGRGSTEGFAEDYAYIAQGLLDLYAATFDLQWLRWAERMQSKMDQLFADEADGGYFNSAAGAPDMIIRLKEDYDGAEPAPTSIAVLNLLRLDALLGGGAPGPRRARALRALDAFRPRWAETPQSMPQLLCALEMALDVPRHVVLAGMPGSPDFAALAKVTNERLGPMRAVLAVDGSPDQAWLVGQAPWLAAMTPQGGHATAYVCEEFTCQAPVTRPEDLRRLLNRG